MSRDRFWLLMSFFHLFLAADNAKQLRRGLPGSDPLFKLGNVFRKIVHSFGTLYVPHHHISLDEGMVPWRGNLGFKVYAADKPHRYGIKVYMVCDSHNGYCSKFRIYTGNSEVPPFENGITYDLVMDLMRNYFGQGYRLFVDNYYSSPILFSDLWLLGCGATGTLRANRRGVPQAIKDAAVTKGQTHTMSNGNLSLMKFHDRKVVHLLGTTERADMVPSGKVNPHTGQPVLRPSVVLEYDKYMGGVDRCDQMVSYSTFRAQTMKWYKRVFFHVISLVLTNAYVLFKHTTGSTMLQCVFRKKVVRAFILSVNKDDSPGMDDPPLTRQPSTEEPLNRLQGKHYLQSIKGPGVKKCTTRI